MNEDGWGSASIVKKYREEADINLPGRRDILSIIARAATEFAPEPLRILDVGAGYGEVAATILDIAPHAHMCLIDYSDEMLRLANERFENVGNVTIMKHDLNLGLPALPGAGDYGAVVSCFALHHIDFEKRVPLYRAFHDILKPGGIFINGDCFTGDSPMLSEWELDNYISWVVENTKHVKGTLLRFEEVKEEMLESDRQLGDKPGTIWAMCDDMKQAGFQYVDCFWMKQTLGILAAVKSS
jgi:ubiquinone/menaquinone biosynthesis C-methylase UbiE